MAEALTSLLSAKVCAAHAARGVREDGGSNGSLMGLGGLEGDGSVSQPDEDMCWKWWDICLYFELLKCFHAGSLVGLLIDAPTQINISKKKKE